METITCIICKTDHTKPLFEKASRGGELFTLVRCATCGLEYINPRPTLTEIARYYQSDYFTRRTDRGYNDYFSPGVRSEIERVLALNLADLGFFEFEKTTAERRTLDIGCAAGYSVAYLKERGWESSGIDIAHECIEHGRKYGLDLREGDYLEHVFDRPFSLITMWASIEHLHSPDCFLSKAHRDLEEGGMLYLSTCRTGFFNFKKLFGSTWRYYNFPEHLYFFSYSTIKKLLALSGFEIVRYVTYGSGVGTGGTMKRKIADAAAKRLYLGDMMLIAARKAGRP